MITNSKGHKVGSIIIRYTPSQIGYNNEVGVLLYVGGETVADYSDNIKGSTYSHMNAARLLIDKGVRCFSHNNEIVTNRLTKTGQQHTESFSSNKELERLKIGRKHYRVLWA